MQVKEIMTSQVDYATSEYTLREAAIKMRELDIGELPIVVGSEAVGVITDRDITVRGVARGLDPNAAKVVDAMTEGIVACRQDDAIEDAAKKMGSHKIRRLPVMDASGKMIGMLSLADLALKLDKALLGEVLMEISK
jgi:CBS domain-containing protein